MGNIWNLRGFDGDLMGCCGDAWEVDQQKNWDHDDLTWDVMGYIAPAIAELWFV